MDVEQMARDATLCATVIASGEPVVVSDARTDARMASNPMVTGEFGLRFYCGVPVPSGDGYNLGSLCVLDRKPRIPEPWQVTLLEELASLVILQVELRLAMPRSEAETRLRRIAESQRARAEHDARTDALTGLRNRRAFELDLEVLERMPSEQALGGVVVLLDLDDLKLTNDTLGHAVGDRYLRDVAGVLSTWFRESDRIYRIGGDEFALIMRGETLDVAFVKERLRAVVDHLQRTGHLQAGASAGVAAFSRTEGSVRAALEHADALMYAEKEGKRLASMPSVTGRGRKPRTTA